MIAGSALLAEHVPAAAARPLPSVLDPAAVGDACAWLLEAERAVMS